MIYDLKLDSRGRMVLPKDLKKLYASGVRITTNPTTDIATIEPLDRGMVCAEFDSIVSPEELSPQAWNFNVSIRPLGKTENDDFDILATGVYNDVRSFLASVGIPEEDFDEYLV